ncbi:MAG: SDR family oxidoreductase [Actinobacteria bacterium]|nr:SDR family oxidoreductase [Actinomycetota bacterium]
MGNRLKGKIAVVTGAGGVGIGQGCALAFAREGAGVVGCDVDEGSAEETLAIAKGERLAYESYIADLTEPAAHERLMTFAAERFGGIDILVTAAAFVEFAPIDKMDYQTQWRRTLQGELDLVFLSCKAVWPHLIARGGGSIINFASANAHVALPGAGAVAHCATKGGVFAMTKQLASDGGPNNIRANTISPALIVTKHTKERLDHEPGFKELVMNGFMLKRLGQPEDVGYLAVYLASDESSWVTGADFRIDGGATAF